MSLNVSTGVGACRCWLANIPSSFGLTGLLESSSKPKPQESHALTFFACSVGVLALFDIRFADARLAKDDRGVPKSSVVDLEWLGIKLFTGEADKSTVVDREWLEALPCSAERFQGSVGD